VAFRSILCPVDLSASSRAAAKAAAVMADCFDARLTVVFVDDPLLSRAALRFDEQVVFTQFAEHFIDAAFCTQPFSVDLY